MAGGTLDVRLCRLAHEVQRSEYVASPWARLCRSVFGDLVEAVANSPAQIAYSGRRGAVFVNQPALFGLEILYCVVDGGKQIGVVEIVEATRSYAALRIEYRELDPVKSEQRSLIEPHITWVGNSLLSSQLHFSLAGTGASLNQIRARLGTSEFYHPLARATDGADLRPERGTQTFGWAFIAAWACRHREQVTGEPRGVTRLRGEIWSARRPLCHRPITQFTF